MLSSLRSMPHFLSHIRRYLYTKYVLNRTYVSLHNSYVSSIFFSLLLSHVFLSSLSFTNDNHIGEEIVSGAQRIHDVALLTERAEHWKVESRTCTFTKRIDMRTNIMRESIGDSLRGCIKDSNEAGWIL